MAPARVTLVLLVLAFGLSWPATPAAATTPSAGEEPPSGGRMVLVLDSSGSMKERAAGGETKIAAAKKALRRVIGSLPDDQSVGLRVYGAEVFAKGDPGVCTDSQLVVPVGTGNRAGLRDAVASYEPYGETPIGYALQQAGKDLGGEGKRTIVLVSDGEPTCAPDPCKVARDLSQQGVDLKIDVVGLDVDGSAREKLRCIAGAGNGSYYDVDSSEEFAASLEKLATRAARPFSAIGRPVAGTPTPDGAPEIVAGDWLDQLGTSEADLTKHYVVRREVPGSTLHVSASLRTADGSGEMLDVRLTEPEGTDCGFDSEQAIIGTGQLLSTGVSADTITSFGEVDPDDPCGAADQVLVEVVDKARTVTGPRPLEVRVIEEPPVESPEELPQPDGGAGWVDPTGGGGSTAVTGGASFTDAPLLEPGTYRDAIVPGEVLVYQVDVAWGQQLAAQVDFPKPGSRLAEAIGNEMFTRVDAYGPTRQMATTNGQGAASNQSFLPNTAHTTATYTAPVTYLNRGGTTSAAGAALAGRYTVAVYVEQDPQDESYVIPFTLALGVSGEESGAPTYTEQPAEIESSSTPHPSQEPDASPPIDSDGGLSAGFVVGGIGVLALLAAGYVALRSRRP